MTDFWMRAQEDNKFSGFLYFCCSSSTTEVSNGRPLTIQIPRRLTTQNFSNTLGATGTLHCASGTAFAESKREEGSRFLVLEPGGLVLETDLYRYLMDLSWPFERLAPLSKKRFELRRCVTMWVFTHVYVLARAVCT